MFQRFLFLFFLGFLLLPSLAFAHDSSETSSGNLHYTKDVEHKGKVVFIEAEGKNGGHISLVSLVTPSGRQYILDGKKSERLRAGSRVQIEGQLDASADRFAADGQVLVRSVEVNRVAGVKKNVSGVRGAMVAFVSWPGSGTSGYGTYQAQLGDLTDWSSAASDATFSWNPVTRVNLVLDAPLVDCSNPTADYLWRQTVVQELQSLGYDLTNDYRALAIALPQSFAADCVGTAYAYVDSSCTWMTDSWCNLSVYSYNYSNLAVFVHELGHTLSLPHADKAPCLKDGSAVPLTYSGTCTHIEYGDRYDPMGTSFSNAMYNPAFSDQLGWISAGDIVRLEGNPASSVTSSVDLTPYGGLTGTRALAIDLPAAPELGDASPGTLYLEYRANAGLDSVLYSGSELFSVSCLAWTPASNVFLRFLPSAAAASYMKIAPNMGLYGLVDESYLLDMKPATSTACDSGLEPGQVWQDPTGKLQVSFQSRSASTASLSITRDPWTDTTAPNLTLEQSANQADPSSSSPLQFSLTGSENLDASSVAASDFSVAGGTVSSVSGSGSSYIIQVLPSGNGNVSLNPSNSFAVADLKGNVSSSAGGTDRSVLYDTTSPALPTFSRIGTSPTASSSVFYNLSFSESVKSFGSSAVSLTGSATGCQSSLSGSGASRTLQISSCSEGTVTPTVLLSLVKDQADNFGSGQVALPTASFDRSTTKPLLSAKPPARTKSRKARFVFSGEAGATFSCSLDGRALRACLSPKSYKKLRVGRHIFLVQAKDTLGNKNSMSYAWRITG